MKTVSIERAKLIRLLLYGDSGSGKTHFIGTCTECPDMSPVLVLNSGGQPVTFVNFEHPPLVLNVDSMSDFNEVYTWVLQDQPWTNVIYNSTSPFFKAVHEYFGDTPGTFKTVAIDSITHTQRVSMSSVVGSGTTLPGDMPKSPQIQHWGSTLRQIVNLVNLYYQLPVHVIMTALTKWTTLEDIGATMFSPFLWGQSSLEVPSHAEIVGRLVRLEGLAAQKATVLKTAMPEEWKAAENILLLRGGRNFFAKWQGKTEPPEFILGPTATKLLEAFTATT